MIIEAIVEIPEGSPYKYEVDKNTNELVLDRVLPFNCPYNYGYIPHTLCGDGDPLDIFIISRFPIPSKTRVKIKLLKVYRCNDNGEQDDKLVGVLVGEEDMIYPGETDLELFLSGIEDYLTSYKEGFKLISRYGPKTAEKVVKEAVKQHAIKYSPVYANDLSDRLLSIESTK